MAYGVMFVYIYYNLFICFCYARDVMDTLMFLILLCRPFKEESQTALFKDSVRTAQ